MKFLVIALLLLAEYAAGQTSDPWNPSGITSAAYPVTSVKEYGARGDGVTNDTVAIQRAIDSGNSPLLFNSGTYLICSLLIRANNQVWRGAGGSATILKATPSCVNMILTSSTGGPAASIEISGMKLVTDNSTNLINLNGRDVFRAHIHHNEFELSTPTSHTQGITSQGVNDLEIDSNEFYSSTPGHGKPVLLTNGGRNNKIRWNTVKWTFQGFEWGTGGGDGTQVVGNDIWLGWPFLPIKFTNSGGTVTYTGGPPDTTLNDSAANFTGLCNDTGSPPATCTGGNGNMMRLMGSIATGGGATVNYNSGGNRITDTAANFISAAVKEGDIVTTEPLCRGNGSLPLTSRASCTGSAGTAAWGDRCECTSNSDCGSNVCEKRFSSVVRVDDATHLTVDEWTGYTDRRPVGAPVTGDYTVYAWAMCVIGSYTSTSATCSSISGTNFKDWYGTALTIADGTMYEIMGLKPNYPILENAAATNSYIADNTINYGYSDNIFTQGANPTVARNTVLNGYDHCYNIQGSYARVIGNVARHCGQRGVANFSPYSTMTGNTGFDTPFVGTGTSGCPIVVGLSSGLPATLTANWAITSLPLATTTSGICVQNNSDGVVLDGNRCQGTFATACIRNDTANNVNTRILNYGGETISNVGTYSIQGGRATFAQMNAAAAQNGSFVGCSDCNATCTAGSSNGKLCQRVNAAWAN